MLPFSYSRCAICMVLRGGQPSLRAGLLLQRGGPERRVRLAGVRLGLDRADGERESRSAAASAVAVASSRWTVFALFSSPVEAKSRPWATRRLSTETSRDRERPRRPALAGVQGGVQVPVPALRNAIRSRSRSTTIRIATDWTRPADSLGMTFFQSTGETS